MNALWRWLGRALAAILALLIPLVAPIAWLEVACSGTAVASDHRPLVEAAWQRPESRTLLTYPEWHIVHAYEDYARVIATGDPHDFGYLRAIAGFWRTACPLKREAMRMGPVTLDTKLAIYTIGASFTAELLAKAAYEETLGRVVTWLRGPERAPLDDLSARQAADYAAFLTQTPWYRWNFSADAAALGADATDDLRDRERAVALGLEYRAKAVYAGLIAGAVVGVGKDELRLRSVVTGLPQQDLADIPGVTVLGPVSPGGVLIETDRYRAFTDLARHLAEAGADVVEIAGNDEILFTALSPSPTEDGALLSLPRQGFGDWRHLFLVPVPDLLERLRALDGSVLTLEHIHDY